MAPPSTSGSSVRCGVRREERAPFAGRCPANGAALPLRRKIAARVEWMILQRGRRPGLVPPSIANRIDPESHRMGAQRRGGSSMVRSGVVGVLLLSMLCALAVPAHADYPDRPVTAIVGFPAGGLADVVLRAVAEGMKKKFPKGLAVVNRSGAGGTIGASEIVTSKPDGNTFGIVAVANLVIQPQLTDLPYRTPDDYVPFIGLVSWSPLLAVRQDAPWKTAQEFITAARAAPGKLRVASPGEGTGSHLMLEELMNLANM